MSWTSHAVTDYEGDVGELQDLGTYSLDAEDLPRRSSRDPPLPFLVELQVGPLERACRLTDSVAPPQSTKGYVATSLQVASLSDVASEAGTTAGTASPPPERPGSPHLAWTAGAGLQHQQVGSSGKVFLWLWSRPALTWQQLGTMVAVVVPAPVASVAYCLFDQERTLNQAPDLAAPADLSMGLFMSVGIFLLGVAFCVFIAGVQDLCFHGSRALRIVWVGLLGYTVIIVGGNLIMVAAGSPQGRVKQANTVGPIVLAVLYGLGMVTYASRRHKRGLMPVPPAVVVPGTGEPAPDEAQYGRFGPWKLHRTLRALAWMFILGPLLFFYEGCFDVVIKASEGQAWQMVPVFTRILTGFVVELVYYFVSLGSPAMFYWFYAYYVAARHIFAAIHVVLIRSTSVFVVQELAALAPVVWLYLAIRFRVPLEKRYQGLPRRLQALVKMDFSPGHLVSILALHVLSQLMGALLTSGLHLPFYRLPPLTLVFMHVTTLRAVVVLLVVHWAVRRATGLSVLQGCRDALSREALYFGSMLLFLEIQAVLLLTVVSGFEAWSS